MPRQHKRRAPKRTSKGANKEKKQAHIEEQDELTLDVSEGLEQSETTEKEEVSVTIDEQEDGESEEVMDEVRESDDIESEETPLDEDIIGALEGDISDEELPDGEEDEAVFEEGDTDEETASVDKHHHFISSVYDEDIDMTTLDQTGGRRWWILWSILGIIAIGVLSWFGYGVFTGNDGGSGDVVLQLEVEERVASGDIVTLEIVYENRKDVAITDGSIEVFYPDGFRYYSSSIPADDSDDESAIPKNWSFDSVAPGAAGRIRITGQLVGEKDEVKNFRALLNYEPENFSQQFQETAETDSLITSSLLEVEVDAPSQVQSGQEFNYSVTYTNTSSAAMERVQVLLAYPDGFTVISSSEEPTSNDNEWRYDILDAGESRTLELTGALEGESGEEKEIQFQLGLFEIDNSVNVQIQETVEIVIINPELEMSVSLPEAAEPGDSLEATITVKNTSQAEIKNLDLQVLVEGAIFEDTILDIETIKTVSPLAEKTRTVTLDVLDAIEGTNPQGIVTVGVTGAIVDGNEVTFGDTTSATVSIASSVDVSAQARYFDDSLKKIGTGPLPPQVNAQTNYVIIWTITNGSNDLENVSVTTTLPETAIWVREASSGIEYDSANRLVSYAPDSLAAGESITLSFTVGISPTQEDVDSLMVLTQKTNFRATDTVTDEKIVKEFERLTTALPDDEGAVGTGVVVSNTGTETESVNDTTTEEETSTEDTTDTTDTTE